jgi:hypothetical protein
MKKKHSRLMKKQLIKYALIIIIFIVGMFIYRILWELTIQTVYIGLIIFGSILVISVIFDWISMKDLLPIFGK